MLRVFGQNVLRERKDAGLTQEVLADVLGVSREYVSDIEHGRVNVSMTRVAEIASALDTPVESLFFGVTTREH